MDQRIEGAGGTGAGGERGRRSPNRVSKSTARERPDLIVLDALLKGRGLQDLVQVLYQMLDNTRNMDLEVDSGWFSVLGEEPAAEEGVAPRRESRRAPRVRDLS